MTHADIEALLIAAFTQCEMEGCALTSQQKQIISQMIQELASNWVNGTPTPETGNPLDDLTPEQRQALLAFVRAEDIPIAPGKSNFWMTGYRADLQDGSSSFAISMGCPG